MDNEFNCDLCFETSDIEEMSSDHNICQACVDALAEWQDELDTQRFHSASYLNSLR